MEKITISNTGSRFGTYAMVGSKKVDWQNVAEEDIKKLGFKKRKRIENQVVAFLYLSLLLKKWEEKSDRLKKWQKLRQYYKFLIKNIELLADFVWVVRDDYTDIYPHNHIIRINPEDEMFEKYRKPVYITGVEYNYEDGGCDVYLSNRKVEWCEDGQEPEEGDIWGYDIDGKDALKAIIEKIEDEISFLKEEVDIQQL